ncbi:alpha/beta hydrolase [Petrachloros mirabilis]
MEEALTFQDEWGHRVSAILSKPEGNTSAAVILCHGFLSNKNSTTNKTLTRLLNERALTTFRFDFFGQGESEGLFEDITTTLAVGQAKAAISTVLSIGYRTIGLVGSSFGGLVSILTTARRRDIACLALKCPVVDFAEELRLEFGPDEMARWQTTGTIPNILGGTERVRLKYGLYEDCLQQIAYEPAAQIFVPTLIVQGQKDEMIPLHQSLRLFDSLKGRKRLDILPEGDHQFTRGEDFRAMTASITQWLEMHLVHPYPSETRS